MTMAADPHKKKQEALEQYKSTLILLYQTARSQGDVPEFIEAFNQIIMMEGVSVCDNNAISNLEGHLSNIRSQLNNYNYAFEQLKLAANNSVPTLRRNYNPW